ncbi:MAG: hypothetical protein P8M72_04220 [Gammaproteobacteria bacterium]|nr:hypothetical protein [Gammaproteobacteria bacterium]
MKFLSLLRTKLSATFIALIAFSLTAITSTSAQAQDDTVYPANAAEVSYAELDNLPDFRGLWFPAFRQVGGDEPVLIGEALATWEVYAARMAIDPNFEVPETTNNCEPDGMPYIMNFPYSVEFLFTPGKITVIQEALMQVRRIFTDGRPMPARDELDPNYFGYSRGHWEGDTLVVTTIGTQPGQRLGRPGITNSDQLTITERIYLDEDNPDQLHLDWTFVDSKVLAQPWHMTHTFRRDRTWEQLEYICSQNDRHLLDEEGQTLPPEEIRN